MGPHTLLRRARASVAATLVTASTVAVSVLAAAPPASADPPSRPNIVVINTDDQRFDSLYSCLGTSPDGRTPPGGSVCPMPNVQSDLMAHGVTFAESFVTTSLCCPSRASLFLGEFAHRTGVLTNEKPNGGFSAFRSLQDSTVARWLHDSGYRTSLIGKYLNQYDSCASVPSCPVPQGWDDWHAEITDGDVDYTDFQLADSIGGGQAAATPYSTYSTTLLGQKAVSFVQDTLTNHPAQPLFLYLAPFAPHPSAVPATGDGHAFDSMTWRSPPAGTAPPSWNQDPVNGPTWSTDLANNPDHMGDPPNPKTLESFLEKKDKEHRNEMESLLEIDRQVHAVVQALGTQASNTLFVFTSDNGLSWGEHRYFDKKNCEFEECHRVPMVVRYDPLTDPSGTEPGRVDATHAVLNVDIAPTAADAGQLTDAPAMDGRSLLPLLDASAGNDPADWRTAILGEDYGGLISCRDCVKTPTLKLIRTLPSDPLGAWKYVELCALTDKTNPCPITERELYDETNDRYETNNVAVANPAPGSVQAMLASRLALLGQTHSPGLQFTAGPPPSTADSSASFTFSAVGASRYWCSLDGAPRTPCASPVDLPGPLAEGPHTFAVVAEGEDASDGVTGTGAPVVRAWTIDNGAPDTTITAGPSGPTSSTTAQFSFTSNEQNVTFRCSLDGAPFAACTSPASYPNLTETQHTFAVKAVDAANNEDPTPDTRTWTVDVTPPDTSIDSGPSGPTNQAGPYAFTFSSTEAGSTFMCRPSGGGFAPCTSPYNYAVPGDGSYSLTVKAVDPAGNTDASPASRSWTVDTVPPAAPVLSSKPTNPSGPSATFAWTESDATAAFACTLDGTSAACTSPVSYPALTNGGHAFSVTATDPAGNSSGPASYAWTVSTSGPVVTIADSDKAPPEGSFTKSRSAKLKFSSNMSGTTFECALDADPFASCVSPISYSGLVDGLHVFSVRGTAAGTTGAVAQRTWTVDNAAPDTTITGGPPATTRSSGPFEFTFSSTEAGSTFKCKLDSDGFFLPCPNPYDIAGPLSGTHTLQVEAVDQAGNQDQTAATGTWTVDTTPPPVPSITQNPPAASASTGASFAFSDTESGVAFLCSLDGAPAVSCSSPQTYSSLAEGLHTFAVQAVDAAGNPSAPASWQWTVDLTPPDTTITDGPSGAVGSPSAQFTFESNEAGATFQCSLDGTAFSGCSSPASYSDLGAGDHTFAVRAVDAAGNQDPTPDSRTWTVTTTVPDTTILTGPSAGSWSTSTAATFTFSSTIEGSTFECSLDGAAFAPCDSGGAGASPTGLGQGPHAFAVYAESGGTPDPTPASRSWRIDSQPPAASVNAPDADGFVLASPVTVKWTTSDPAPSSGALTSALLERPGSSTTYATVASGTARQASREVGTTTCWMATATDPAGNTGASPDVCASLPFDDRSTSLSLVGPTQQVDDPGAYQGTITRLQGDGAEIGLSFTGRKVGILMQKGPDTGKARIFVDDTLVQTVDAYASSVGQKKFLWNGVLAAGPHVVRVAWTGTKNKNSTGYDVAIDGIAIIATP